MQHVFGPEAQWPRQDLIAFSAEFDAPLVVAAYQSGVFPMPLLESEHADDMGWWSPMRRGILPLGSLRLSRSLRRSARRYTTTVDLAFGEVMQRCAAPGREGAWITASIIDVFTELHARSLAHSVEVWDDQGCLVGGLYGVNLGGLFAGESMFHDPERGRDASKVALIRLVDELSRDIDSHRLDSLRLLDVQWVTDHLASLGAREVPRQSYLSRLEVALEAPTPRWRSGPGHRMVLPGKGDNDAGDA